MFAQVYWKLSLSFSSHVSFLQSWCWLLYDLALSKSFFMYNFCLKYFILILSIPDLHWFQWVFWNFLGLISVRKLSLQSWNIVSISINNPVSIALVLECWIRLLSKSLDWVSLCRSMKQRENLNDFITLLAG